MAGRKKGRNQSSKPRGKKKAAQKKNARKRTPAKKKAAKRKSVPQSADAPSDTNPLRALARAFAAHRLR